MLWEAIKLVNIYLSLSYVKSKRALFRFVLSYAIVVNSVLLYGAFMWQPNAGVKLCL